MGKHKKKKKQKANNPKRWRKLNMDKMVKSRVKPYTDEDRRKELALLTDAALWTEDCKPRDKRPKKAQKQSKARRRLLKLGIITNDLTTTSTTNPTPDASKPIPPLFETKRKRKRKEIIPPITKVHSRPPPQREPKKISLPTSRRSTVRAYDSKATHWTKKYSKHSGIVDDIKCRQSAFRKGSKTRSSKMKDLWESEPIQHFNAERRKQKIKDASAKGKDSKLKNNGLLDVNPAKLILNARRSTCVKPCKETFKLNAPIPNPCLRTVDAISFPKPGESINPLRHEYFYRRWKVIRHSIFMRYRQHYGNATVEEFWRNLDMQDDKVDDTLLAMKKEAERVKKLCERHWSIYKNTLSKVNLEMKSKDGVSLFVKPDRGDKKYKNVHWKGNEVKGKGKTMWGPNHRYRFRIENTMGVGRLDKSLRQTVHTNYDHPASFLFDEMRKQHKVPGFKKKGYIKKRRGFLGPRFKTTSRIGKVHHNNVNNPLFAEVDEIVN